MKVKGRILFHIWPIAAGKVTIGRTIFFFWWNFFFPLYSGSHRKGSNDCFLHLAIQTNIKWDPEK